MRITKWGEYGILCSLHLARKPDASPVGASEIAEQQQIPIEYAQQILQRLRKGDIVRSVRGPHGGYVLAHKPEETTLKNILEAAEGATLEIICDSNPIYPDSCANTRNCGLRAVWQDLKVSIDQLLSSRSLAWIMEREAEGLLSAQDILVPGPKAAQPRGLES